MMQSNLRNSKMQGRIDPSDVHKLDMVMLAIVVNRSSLSTSASSAASSAPTITSSLSSSATLSSKTDQTPSHSKSYPHSLSRSQEQSSCSSSSTSFSPSQNCQSGQPLMPQTQYGKLYAPCTTSVFSASSSLTSWRSFFCSFPARPSKAQATTIPTIANPMGLEVIRVATDLQSYHLNAYFGII